ncbi:hypothetical protein MVEG_05149 [Podila verticillata NRRL 6337]|nr:hypothetical protein MVEG_05149 [Podila verticillata NRRL 6337]
MFKNIFQAPDSLRNAILGQDELRAKSQQGLQAVRSGVESLRTVLSNNEANSRRGAVGSSPSFSPSTPSATTTSRVASLAAAAEEAISPVGRAPRPLRDHAESWSALGTSSSSSGGANNSTHRKSVDGNHPFSNNNGTPNARPGSAASITDAVAESIKSLGKELTLGLGGLGLTPSSGVGFTTTTTTATTTATTGSGHVPHRNNNSGSSSSSSRTRVWMWNGQESTTTEMRGSESSDVTGASGRALKTGVKTEAAAKETEAMLTKIRMQQDAAVARAKRMPEVEKMAQRYQDSWTEIHQHTTRNAEKADDADEILEKILEMCRRHVDTAVEMKAEAKQLKAMEQSMDEMISLSENIQKKLVGLEDAIEKLEMDAEVMSLADWKKSKVSELDKYMDAKRKELWDKAEMLATRSVQFQREESARKLQLYENQFERDMAHFRQSKEEQEQELWKSIETGDGKGGADGDGERGGSISQIDTLETMRPVVTKTLSLPGPGKRPAMPPTLSKIQLAAVPSSILSVRATSSTGVLDDTSQPMLTVGGIDQDEDRREKEDLDKFLGSASENGDNSEDMQESEMDSDEDEDDEDDDDEEEEEEEDSSSGDDALDPIEMARKARASATSSSSGSKASEVSWAKGRPGFKNSNAMGSTISLFSTLAKHPSTTSISRP